MRTDLYLEKLAKKQRLEVECASRMRDEVSLVLDGVEGSRKMPLEGTERV